MLFCSNIFLFFFLPVFMAVYYLVPRGWANFILFTGSIIFYGYGERIYLVLILISLILHFYVTQRMEKCEGRRRKFWLLLLLGYGFGMLFIFKYLGFFAHVWNEASVSLAAWAGVTVPLLTVPKLSLPLGISFYTFQIAAYAVDVYRGKIRADRSFVRLGAFISMFPQLIAGPIVLYHEVAAQLRNRTVNWANIEEGLKTFIIGLSMKMLLANTFGQLWNQVQVAGAAAASLPMAWTGAAGYTLQIFFDFQGYSLMAIGLGRMMGFILPENFNYPYTAVSVTDFWHRWHMTLSGWFRDYVYIPLGGSHKGQARMVFNLFVVWALTGLWHGANYNFVLWGLYYFILLTAEKLVYGAWLKRHRLIGHIYTMAAVISGWMIFAVEDIGMLKAYLLRMFPFGETAESIFMHQEIMVQTLHTYGIYLALGTICCLPLPFSFYNKYKKHPVVVLCLTAMFTASVYVICTAASNPFLYFRF